MGAEQTPAIVRLTLKGHIPAKKNLKRPWVNRKTGKLTMIIDRDIKAQIDALTFQAKRQWRRPPAEHPDVDFEFFVINAGADTDNMYTTILDVLQEAGVIVNDNVNRFNGTKVIHPAVVGAHEGVIIDISEKQAALIVGNESA